MTYPSMAGDIAKTLKQLNISRAVVIGHSMGGKVAMEFSLSMPGSVEKLIVEDVPPMAAPAPLATVILSAVINLDLTRINRTSDADDMLKESIPVSIYNRYAVKPVYRAVNRYRVSKNIVERLCSGFIIGNLHNRLKFDLGKKSKLFYNNLIRHHKTSKTAKFCCETL